LVGGLVMGALSALPIISAGNLCCCLWIISGGVVAAYVLQQNQPTPIVPSDGALVGLLAGIVGACIYLVLSVPITFLIAPMQRQVLERLMDRVNNVPPEFREFMDRSVAGPLSFAINFVLMLMLGAIFSTIGGLLGAVFFRKGLPPSDQRSPTS
jgi:hypothetical protein